MWKTSRIWRIFSASTAVTPRDRNGKRTQNGKHEIRTGSMMYKSCAEIDVPVKYEERLTATINGKQEVPELNREMTANRTCERLEQRNKPRQHRGFPSMSHPLFVTLLLLCQPPNNLPPQFSLLLNRSQSPSAMNSVTQSVDDDESPLVVVMVVVVVATTLAEKSAKAELIAARPRKW